MMTDALAALPTAALAPAPLILVDGSGFIFRAFHALPPLNRPSDGVPVGAVYGFCTMLAKLLAERPQAMMLVVFDVSRKSFRSELYPEYKAHRPPAPEELVPQFPLIREAVAAFGLPSVELEGYEADDLIATYARVACAAGHQVEIVSSDKDLMQLIKDGISMTDPLKGKAIGLPEVAEKFGTTPDKVGDVLALMGDSSDNIPGAPSIGPKTAAQLIADFGSLEALLARAHEIPQPKRRAAIMDNIEIIRLSRRLVALDEHTPLPIALEALTHPEPNKERLGAFLQQQGFKSLVAKLGVPQPAVMPISAAPISAAPVSAPEAPAQPPINRATYALVQDEASLARWIARAFDTGILAVDCETTSLTPSTTQIVGISLSPALGEACYIPLTHGMVHTGQLDFGAEQPPQIAPKRAMELLKAVLEDASVLKIGQNLKFDWQVFAQYGVKIAPYDDTMLLSYVLDSGLHGHGMDELSERFLNHKPIAYSEVCGTGKAQIGFDQVPLDKACAYAAEDADVTLRLWHVLKPRLAAERMVTLYETIERPMVHVVAKMEQAGVKVDASVLRHISGQLAERMVTLEQEIIALAGQEFNVASPKQLGEILFDKLGLQGGSKGKTGAYSTDAEALETLAEQGHEIAAKVLEWRQWQKLRSTYAEALPQQISPKTGRVHTAYALSGTLTGRMSSSDPNLQNIPIRTPEGRSIRKAFVAAEGCVLMSVDYSQIELRLLAHMANIPALKQAFIDGIDIHARTASEVFGVPLAQMTPDLRRNAKAINFGIVYGISAFGLARQLGISNSEAAQYIRIYFERFPELKAYMDNMKAFAKTHGYVETLFGRKCHLPSIHDRNAARKAFAERQAINAPLQGTAADIIKRAMVKMDAALAAAHLKATMLLQVHDELVFEVPLAEVDATKQVVKQVMEAAAALSVPLIAEVGMASNWAEAH